MFCRNCGKLLDNQAVVCVACGFGPGAGGRFCRNCGGETQPGAAVCLKCGAALAGGFAVSGQKPGMLMAVAIITLVSGILNIIWGSFGVLYSLVGGLFTFGIACLCLPLYVYLLIVGILEVLYAMKLLPEPIKTDQPNQGLAVMEIVCILALNPIALVAGILALVFYNDKSVTDYFAARAAPR